MLDEMTNPALIDHVLDDEDATERERELADRLHAAMHEIDLLVHRVQTLEALGGSNT